jgi:hypothetical protein
VVAGAAAAERTLACGNCREPMQPLVLPGHYGKEVEIDLCSRCDLVWFDSTETAHVTGPALLDLIGLMAKSQTLPHEMLHAKTACPRCGATVKVVHNQSRWGRSTQLQCVARHGAYQSFAQFLGEKGLLRPMSRIDRAKLVRDRGHIDCVNCGARIDTADETCRFCRSVPSLLDVARLARALDPHEMLEPHAAHAAPARQQAMQCAACGVALPPGETVSCSQCGATLAITRLAEAHASVEALAPALRAAAERPPAKVVQRRLDALAGDIPRRREWVAGMEAQVRERRAWGEEPFEWSTLWSKRTNPVRAVLIALAAWWAWQRWR